MKNFYRTAIIAKDMVQQLSTYNIHAHTLYIGSATQYLHILHTSSKTIFSVLLYHLPIHLVCPKKRTNLCTTVHRSAQETINTRNALKGISTSLHLKTEAQTGIITNDTGEHAHLCIGLT